MVGELSARVEALEAAQGRAGAEVLGADAIAPLSSPMAASVSACCLAMSVSAPLRRVVTARHT